MSKRYSYLEDEEVRKFKSFDEFNSFAKDRKEGDLWIETACNDTVVIGVENNPICATQLIGNLYHYQGDKETFKKTMATHGLLLQVHDVNDTLTYDIRDIGLSSIYSRAGLLGRTIRDVNNALGSILRSEWLTKSLSLYSDPAKVLVRDGKVSTMLSSRYNVFHSADLIRSLESYLDDTWKGWSFDAGLASHEIIDASFLLENRNEEAKKALEDLGFKCRRVDIFARFVTSDIGDNAATLYPILKVDGLNIMLGEAIKVAHTNKDGLSAWDDGILKFSSLLKKGQESIEALATKKIRNSGGCLRYMACELKLPKDISLEVGAEMDAMYISGCSALDIYYYLHEIVSRYIQGKDISPVSKLNYEETVARSLGMDFKDVPFEWE
jgi:hypothetical protein